MKDRVPGAPGQYTASVTLEERSKLESGKPFSITLARDDQPLVEGTPYSKAAVLPDDVATVLCPGVEDPTPADAFKALIGRTKARAGFIYPLASETVPEGFLLCDGAAYSRTEYAELFEAIGTTYGVGDGSTTFHVPNLSTRVPVGAGDGYDLGATGGEESHQLTVEEMPQHSHTVHESDNGSLITVQWTNKLDTVTGTQGAVWTDLNGAGSYLFTNTCGDNQPHNIMQPYTVVNYIIATGKGEDVGYVVAGTASGGDTSVIDDSVVSAEKTWSSQKIKDEIANGSGGGITPEQSGAYPVIVIDIGEYAKLADFITTGMEDNSSVILHIDADHSRQLDDIPYMPVMLEWCIEIHKSSGLAEIDAKCAPDFYYNGGDELKKHWRGIFYVSNGTITWKNYVAEDDVVSIIDQQMEHITERVIAALPVYDGSVA